MREILLSALISGLVCFSVMCFKAIEEPSPTGNDAIMNRVFLFGAYITIGISIYLTTALFT